MSLLLLLVFAFVVKKTQQKTSKIRALFFFVCDRSQLFCFVKQKKMKLLCLLVASLLIVGVFGGEHGESYGFNDGIG